MATKITKTRDELEEEIRFVLYQNTTSSLTGKTIIEEDQFFSVIEAILDEVLEIGD